MVASAATPTWSHDAAQMVHGLGRLEPRVAAAMRRVPRHEFLSPELRREAYEDTPLPLGPPGSTISAPHMVALMLEWSDLSPGLRVLELGSGSGYMAALLAELIRPEGCVTAVELDAAVAERSREVLSRLGYAGTVAVQTADGRHGWPQGAPYDRIVVSFATPEIFPEWLEQLATPGVLLAPVGPSTGQVLRRIRRGPQGDRADEGPACIFVGLASPHARPK